MADKEPDGVDLADELVTDDMAQAEEVPVAEVITTEVSMVQMRQELISIRGLLVV
jgi:hypothetical protein